MSFETPTIRILIADDHEVVRAGVSAILQRQPDMKVVDEAENGRQAVEKFRLHKPDVAIFDLNMPIMSGIEATAAIMAEFPNSRIIVLTVAGGDENIFQALHAGARSYLLKDTLGKDLVGTVRAVYTGEIRIPSEVAMQLSQRATVTDLTPRELDVLRLIAKGHSNKEIATILDLTEGTVKGYVSVMLSKLQVNDRTQAVTKAFQRGLIQL